MEPASWAIMLVFFTFMVCSNVLHGTAKPCKWAWVCDTSAASSDVHIDTLSAVFKGMLKEHRQEDPE